MSQPHNCGIIAENITCQLEGGSRFRNFSNLKRHVPAAEVVSEQVGAMPNSQELGRTALPAYRSGIGHQNRAKEDMRLGIILEETGNRLPAVLKVWST
jgi:hypothetical protein